ncbi:MAG: P1 family peptidase [Anaerolineales bacterium]|nr:P1 family peptidase [Anaerolineales bacterium]
MPRRRLRDLGITIGRLPPGPLNAITDVAGVRVGHTTLVSGDGPLRPGYGPVRTGVTIVLAHGGNIFQEKVRAAVHTINGFGKVFGFEQARELGVLEAPIALTNTLNVGLVVDALVQYSIRQNPDIGIRSSTANVIVGETHDGYLNDIQGRHVKAEHVWAAIESARGGPVAEGAVGAGAGTSCLGWKGGIGTASRRLPPELGSFILGALVQSNFGEQGDLVIAGVPVGQRLSPPSEPAVKPPDGGSIMVVLACDAPLSSRQLGRLCVRVSAGLARTGGHLSHGSGDFVIAFSTAQRIPHAPQSITATQPVLIDEGPVMDGLFRAVIESVEEAVLNSLCCAETVVGRDGRTSYALPLEQAAKTVLS